MTKNEFLAKLADELKKNNIADSDDIINEYEQHFAFKMADGFSEEEIAARLGNPAALASHYPWLCFLYCQLWAAFILPHLFANSCVPLAASIKIP